MLTFVILLMFAAVVGRLAKDRLEDDFSNEVQATATELAFNVSPNTLGQPSIDSSDLERMAIGPDATIRISTLGGDEVTLNERPLPPPDPGVVHFGDVVVATVPLLSGATGAPTFVQYARDRSELDATIGRLWLFLGVGVAGGAILATLAGLAVAGRAMQPISALTARAREIASTRDPSRRMPEPPADDEVAELARTLDAMLRELDAARAETQAMVQAQREFIADASHELRTPLTSILANLELLQHSLDAEALGGDESEIVDSALRSSRRMRRLVADLLLLARADAGRRGAQRRLDLADVAATAVVEVEPVAGDHRLEVLASSSPVEGNADELHRLVTNLLDNGIRHTPPGTTILLETKSEGGAAVLEVSDDGPGLPRDMEEQVFSRFVRGGGPADVSADSGTGLGLAIVRAVAESHGGTVSAGRSRRGGARFKVVLPSAAGSQERPAPVSTPA